MIVESTSVAIASTHIKSYKNIYLNLKFEREIPNIYCNVYALKISVHKLQDHQTSAKAEF